MNELFRHTYNEEMEHVEKLKALVFPKLEGEENIDPLVIQAIESSMTIVRDQLIKSINEMHQSKSQKSTTHIEQRGIPLKDVKHEKIVDIVQTAIDFYKLFDKSIDNIIQIWGCKLTHVKELDETLRTQHKYQFYRNIIKDSDIQLVFEHLKNIRKGATKIDPKLLSQIREKEQELKEMEAQCL